MIDQLDWCAGGPDPGNTGPGGARIGIVAAHDHAGQAGGGDQIGTGRAARALVGAGFKGDVKRRPARRFAGGSQSDGFGMGASAGLRPAPPDHAAILD